MGGIVCWQFPITDGVTTGSVRLCVRARVKESTTMQQFLVTAGSKKDPIMDDSESRKRPRPLTPRTSLDLAPKMRPPYENEKLQKLQSAEFRNTELNELLKITSNHDINFSLSNDSVVKALVKIVFEILEDEYEPEEEKEFIVFRSKQAWQTPPTEQARRWASKCSQIVLKNKKTDDQKVLLAIAVILRNLSFTGANLRLLAYSPTVLAVLVGLLYIQDTSAESTLHTSVLQTLLNLVPYLDVTGQQLLSSKLFYDPNNSGGGPAMPNPEEFGRTITGEWSGLGACWLAKRFDTKEDIVENVPTSMLLSYTADYLVGCWSLFPALGSIVTRCQTSRPVLLLVLDLLSEFIGIARVGLVGAVQEEKSDVQVGMDYEIPGLRAVLVNLPDAVLQQFVHFLFIPRLGPDALDYIDPLTNVVTRITTLKLSMGYDATIDTDIRDRTLDVLVPLLELDSPNMAARFGTKGGVRLYDALVPVLTTNTGRNDASLLASQVFRELAQAPENKLGLQFVQSKLVGLAASDPRVSRLVWNDLYPIQDESDEGEEGTK